MRHTPCRARGSADRGYVTAETAVVLPVLVLVLLAALYVLAAVTAQLRCVDAAREGARAAARGEAGPVAADLARSAAPSGAVVSIHPAGELVTVTVTAKVLPMGRLAGSLPGTTVHASVSAHAEPR